MPLPPSLSVQVCRKGQLLDPNQAALLRVFGIKMATFRITPLAWWSSEGERDGGRGCGRDRGGRAERRGCSQASELRGMGLDPCRHI